jgi:hypothetical protein
MAMIKNYAQFDGLHYETGPVRNVLAHLGVIAPHTKKPLSEAMLLGISGGVTFGYFLFGYKGYPPQLNLLSRNTFDPLETLLTRLAVPRDVVHSTDEKKAEAALIESLEGNQPAIVWADYCTLPYNDLPPDVGWWAMQPLVVFGLEDGVAHIADRSHKPLTVSAAEFSKARARVKKDKFRQMTLAAPDLTKLKDAVQKGIWQCVALYTEKPPKGAKTNFGFAAFRHWAAMLTNTRNTQSWARFFPSGPEMWSALAGGSYVPGLIGWIHTWGMGDGMERGAYADFLDEAAILLKRPKLGVAAEHFRASRAAWLELGRIAMPDDAPLCREARELIIRKHRLFVEQGQAAMDEIKAANARLREIVALVAKDFPLSDAQVAAVREAMSVQVMKIHDLEYEAVKAMQTAMN